MELVLVFTFVDGLIAMKLLFFVFILWMFKP